ncbi:MAG: universal stress protein [Muribaculaceae bacterium]|nr:universal stress protein [Muribaculaceae bacterium]
MRVLFCTDGSKSSYSSIQNFSCWIKDFTADILCAIDWSFLPDTVSLEDSEFAMQCANSADSILDYSEKFLQQHNIKIGKKIKMCGSTVDCILETSENFDYDFIVLGSHGKKGIQKWLGSVSQEIAAIANNSTYISKCDNNKKKLLFAVDNSEISTTVVEKAVNSFDFEDKEIYLVTVYDIPEYLFLEGNIDSNWLLDIQTKQEKASMLLLNKFEGILQQNGLKVMEKAVLSGSPADEINKYITKRDIDLVVCGIRNRKYLAKFLINSVSKRLLEIADSDVLIIRP